jgi:hypothetical protein
MKLLYWYKVLKSYDSAYPEGQVFGTDDRYQDDTAYGINDHEFIKRAELQYLGRAPKDVSAVETLLARFIAH